VSVLMECQVDFITRHTAMLGEDGEVAMSKIQKKAGEPGCLRPLKESDGEGS
jgi:hypothetical protein